MENWLHVIDLRRELILRKSILLINVQITRDRFSDSHFDQYRPDSANLLQVLLFYLFFINISEYAKL